MSARLFRALISARPPPRDEEMTPLGVRSLSRPAVTAERHARVATLGRVFHQVGPRPLPSSPGRSLVMGSPVFLETRFRVKIRTAPILKNGDRRARFDGRFERT